MPKTHLTAAYSYNKVYLKILECYQGENIIANRPLSTHILYHFNIYNFSLKWHNLITFKGNSHCRFRITLGIPLTMPNKKWIWDCWPLKIFTGHNIDNLSKISRVWRHGNPIDSSGHTSLIDSEHWKQKTVVQRYTSTISREWLVVRML